MKLQLKAEYKLLQTVQYDVRPGQELEEVHPSGDVIDATDLRSADPQILTFPVSPSSRRASNEPAFKYSLYCLLEAWKLSSIHCLLVQIMICVHSRASALGESIRPEPLLGPIVPALVMTSRLTCQLSLACLPMVLIISLQVP